MVHIQNTPTVKLIVEIFPPHATTAIYSLIELLPKDEQVFYLDSSETQSPPLRASELRTPPDVQWKGGPFPFATIRCRRPAIR